MTGQRWWQAVVGGVVASVATIGGSGLATAGSDYPPDDASVTTVLASPAAPAGSSRGEALADTGSDSETTVKLAIGAVVAGTGLLVAAKLRRRPSTA